MNTFNHSASEHYKQMFAVYVAHIEIGDADYTRVPDTGRYSGYDRIDGFLTLFVFLDGVVVFKAVRKDGGVIELTKDQGPVEITNIWKWNKIKEDYLCAGL